MKKTLLINTFLVSVFCCFQVSATELTDALRDNKPLSEIQTLIKNGSNVNQPDEKTGVYPLMLVKDTEIFQELVKAGADIKAKHEYTSVFHEVCRNGTLEMVQYMVKSGANVNEVIGPEYMKQIPLMAAVANKDPRVVEFLIKSGANVKAKIPAAMGDDTVLKTAIITDANPEVIKLLIKNGADVHQKDKYTGSLYEDIVSDSSYPELISIFQEAGLDFKKENLDFLFLRAIENNKSLEMARYLLKLGANPNVQAEKMFMGYPVKEDYPIIVAAKAVRPDALNFLLEQKVNVNVKDKDGKTPLELLQKNQYLIKDPNYNKFIIALGGKAMSADDTKKSQNSMKLLDSISNSKTTVEDVKKLIQDGADVNYKNQYEKTVLMEALNVLDEKTYNEFKENGYGENGDYRTYIQKRLDILELLVQNGADINAKDKYGKNLLFIAVQENQPDILEYLLKKGIDVNSTNNVGETPLMEAATTVEDVNVIKILLKYGADKSIKDKKGLTAYRHAMFNSNPEIQNLLKVSEPVKKYNLPASAEEYYAEMKVGILKEMVLPMVQGTVSDQTKVQSVMKQIEGSIDMEEVKSDSWPCLSKIPESKWNSAEKCFKNFMMDLMQKTVMFTAKANAGENADLKDMGTALSAIQKGAEVTANKAMVKHYANSLLNDASIISTLSIAANAGQGKDISSTEAKEFKGRKIACGAKLYGKKDGSVVIELPDTCIRMEESDERFDISVDEVIEAAKKDEYSLFNLNCTGHKCIGKFKN